jgi:hypothetical protein
MPLKFKKTINYYELSQLSITELNLTEQQFDVLKRLAIENIGDCLNFFVSNSLGMSHIPYSVHIVMYGEVTNVLKNAGYWEYLEEID